MPVEMRNNNALGRRVYLLLCAALLVSGCATDAVDEAASAEKDTANASDSADGGNDGVTDDGGAADGSAGIGSAAIGSMAQAERNDESGAEDSATEPASDDSRATESDSDDEPSEPRQVATPAACDAADERWVSYPFMDFDVTGMVEGSLELCVSDHWTQMAAADLEQLWRAPEADGGAAALWISGLQRDDQGDALCDTTSAELRDCDDPGCSTEYLLIDGFPAELQSAPFTPAVCGSCAPSPQLSQLALQLLLVVDHLVINLRSNLPIDHDPALRSAIEDIMRGARIVTPAGAPPSGQAELDRLEALSFEACFPTT